MGITHKAVEMSGGIKIKDLVEALKYSGNGLTENMTKEEILQILKDKYPAFIDLLTYTTVDDWSTDSGLNLTVNEEKIYLSTTSAYRIYTTLNKKTPIRSSSRLKLMGVVTEICYDTNKSGYQTHGYIEISKNNGVTWTNIFMETATETTETSGTTPFETEIDLSSYDGYECQFRLSTNHTRNSDNFTGGSVAQFEINTFKVMY